MAFIATCNEIEIDARIIGLVKGQSLAATLYAVIPTNQQNFVMSERTE